MIRWLTILLIAIAVDFSSADEIDYVRDVKPILRERCFACHGALKQESQLRLDTVSAAVAAEVVLPGKPQNSPLLQRVESDSDDERMPPEGQPLNAEQIAILRKWIAAGAPAPKDDRPDVRPNDHWAFVAPSSPPIPNRPPESSILNPIDSFLESQRSSAGVATVEHVAKSLLLRRVYLDLVGLPPLTVELDAFLQDERDDAFELVVDRLLASSQYGERWGRHWMDVWRYSDWYGLGQQLRNSQKHIWHWRDWIVQSLNEDKGYDRMVVEMLAADELNPTDLDSLRATGLLARNYYLFNRTTWLDTTIEHTSQAFLGLTLNCAKCHDHKYDPLSHVDYYRMRAIFEPHQVRLDPLPDNDDLEKSGLPRAFDAHPGAVTHVHIRGDEKNPDTSEIMQPGIPEFFEFAPYEPTPVALPIESHWPDGLAFVLQARLQKSQAEIDAANDALSAITSPQSLATDKKNDEHAIKLAEKRLAAAKIRPTVLQTSYDADRAKVTGEEDYESLSKVAAQASLNYDVATAEVDVAQAVQKVATAMEKTSEEKTAADTLLKSAQKKLAEAIEASSKPTMKYPPWRASRKASEGPDETDESRYQPYPKHSTGRRLAFAQWVTDKKNPLTARVAVNHIWMRHFGQPLVETVTDFGRRAQSPMQQDLLDWLSVDLMENGWRMKRLHRLIVTSKAYRLSTATNSNSTSASTNDPKNEYYGRRLPIRMESQVIRDSLLHLAGQLDLQMGGPSIDANQESYERAGRRSLYFKHSRDDQNKLLSMFDDADILRCYRRSESIVPQQVLALANSRLSLVIARRVAERLNQRLQIGVDSLAVGSTEDRSTADGSSALDATSITPQRDHNFVRLAFESVLCRQPDESEETACIAAIRQWRQIQADDLATPKTISKASATAAGSEYARLVHALFNHNDFVTIR